MAIEKREMDYAKEIGDVGALLEAIVKTIKEKGDVTELVDELVTAVSGVEQVDDEMREHRKAALQTMGHHVMGIVNTLLPE